MGISDLGFLRRSSALRRSNTLRRLYRAYSWRFNFRPQVAAAATELERSDDPVAHRLAAALRASIDGAQSDAEKAWIGRIENLRERLARSDEQIQAVDYGTGSAETERTAEEMALGTPVVYTVSDLCLSSSNPPQWDGVLFNIVRRLEPLRAVEMGTCLGLSAAYQGAALELNGRDGHLVTLEGAPTLAERSRTHLDELGVGRVTVRTGRFDDTLGPVVAELKPVDYVFVDGHHDGQATLDYFDLIAPHLGPSAVVVYDDIHYNDDMKRAWDRIAADERVTHAADLGSMGVTLVSAPVPAA
jgi:predicted O-methyltransferase YrrM